MSPVQFAWLVLVLAWVVVALSWVVAMRGWRQALDGWRKATEELEAIKGATFTITMAWGQPPIVRATVEDLVLLERWRPGIDPDTIIYPDVRLMVAP